MCGHEVLVIGLSNNLFPQPPAGEHNLVSSQEPTINPKSRQPKSKTLMSEQIAFYSPLTP